MNSDLNIGKEYIYADASNNYPSMIDLMEIIDIPNDSIIENIVLIITDYDAKNPSALQKSTQQLKEILQQAKDNNIKIKLTDPAGIGKLSIEDLAKRFKCIVPLKSAFADIFYDEKTKRYISEISIALSHQSVYPLIPAMLNGMPLNIYIPHFQMELDAYIKYKHMDKWFFNESVKFFLLEYQVEEDEIKRSPEKIAKFKDCLHQILTTFAHVPFDATLLPQIIHTDCLPISAEINFFFKKTIDMYLANKDLYINDYNFNQLCNFIYKKENYNIHKMLAKGFNLNHITLFGEMILTNVLLHGDLKRLLPLFLKHGLQINLKNFNDESAFHLFAKYASTHRFEKYYIFLKKHFNIDMNQLKNAKNQTPSDIFWARQEPTPCWQNTIGQQTSSHFIFKELNSGIQNLQLDLIEAIQNSSFNAIRDLLNKGANLDLRDSSLQMTPRELAQILSIDLNPILAQQKEITSLISQVHIDPLTAIHGPANTTSFSYDPRENNSTSYTNIPKLSTMSLLANKPKIDEDSEQEKNFPMFLKITD